MLGAREARDYRSETDQRKDVGDSEHLKDTSFLKYCSARRNDLPFLQDPKYH